MLRMFMIKKVAFWPFLFVFPVAFVYRHHDLFVFHNKKYFDMLNVGVQYEMGDARQKVLDECNQLLDTQDF